MRSLCITVCEKLLRRFAWKSLYGHLFSFLLDRYLRITELYDKLMAKYLRNCQTMAASFYIPSNVWWFQFLHIFINFCFPFVLYSILAILQGIKLFVFLLSSCKRSLYILDTRTLFVIRQVICKCFFLPFRWFYFSVVLFCFSCSWQCPLMRNSF